MVGTYRGDEGKKTDDYKHWQAEFAGCGAARESGIVIRRWHDTVIAVEGDLPREGPALPEGEEGRVFAQQHLRLHVPILP